MRDVFEMGSHGCSHRILTHLQPHEIECKIVESKLNLERRLGINVRAFAYPNGGFGDYNDATEEAVRRAGYKLCFHRDRRNRSSSHQSAAAQALRRSKLGLRYFKSLLDGSADLLRLKDSSLGVSVKALVNRTLGLA